MDSYTITILPNDGSGNSTTLVVETAGDQVCITDVRLHAAGGLTGGKLPTIDFGLLLRAVAPASTPAMIEAVPEPAAAVAEPQPEPEPEPAAEPEPEPVAVVEARPAPVAVPRPRRAKRAPAAAPAPA
ncbi:hypothetical protein AB0F10_45650, partial [Actinoplanes sp. NPDC026623]